MTAPPRARRRTENDGDDENLSSHQSSDFEDIEISPDMSVDELYKVRFVYPVVPWFSYFL
jgi:hypothetical protein